MELGFLKQANSHFSKDSEVLYVRFYEAKMFNQYDHRFGTFEGVDIQEIKNGNCRSLRECELINPSVLAIPRYWIPLNELERMIGDKTRRKWLISFRNITNAGNERTVIFTIVPREASGTLAPQVFIDLVDPKITTCLVANFNSIILDFVARQKVGGTHLNHFILRQLPVLAPSIYKPFLSDLIASKVLELIYVANDLEPFANDCGYYNDPFIWDQLRRRQLRSELDAIYFILYGISREEADYIMETFPILKRKEIDLFGEYRYKNMILESYDAYLKESKFFS